MPPATDSLLLWPEPPLPLETRGKYCDHLSVEQDAQVALIDSPLHPHLHRCPDICINASHSPPSVLLEFMDCWEILNKLNEAIIGCMQSVVCVQLIGNGSIRLENYSLAVDPWVGRDGRTAILLQPDEPPF